MSRLTKQLREAMLETMLKHAFDGKEADAKKASIAAGEKIYQDIYGPYVKIMDKLPEGFMDSGSYVRITIGGQHHIASFGEKRRFGHNHDTQSTPAKRYVGDELVALEFLKTAQALEDLKTQRNNVRRELWAVLESIPTFKKLWEVWPESKSILEKYESKPTIAILPAIRVSHLNSVLGLPADTQEQSE